VLTPAPPLSAALSAGGQGCLGVLRAASDVLTVCYQSGCRVFDIKDPTVVGTLATSLPSQMKVDL